LLQRVVGAVTMQRGNVLSSRLDIQSTQAREGFVSVIVNFDPEQGALQTAVCDLEAGMPARFVDQLATQAKAGSLASKFRVVISVSRQWQGAQ
jgi:hypothetical protein